MKSLYLILVLILSVQNCSNQIQDKFPAAVKEVYHQHWIGGVQGGGSGTGFYIEFKTKLPETIVLKQLYFRNGLAQANKTSETQYLFNFVGKANWDRRGELEISDVPAPKTINPPYPIKENEAILEYLYKGERKYFKISNVKEKEMLAYPSARPRN
ncbi:hypothetical protein [Flavobacterium sp. H122]|uniref:hypothetical protein n=1 Tax=Flavobacterium sp. H122 TaxID=2529860 RepID=UPI0010AA60B9|nr:hypothetical protein [Flavobacterium sp. H122]